MKIKKDREKLAESSTGNVTIDTLKAYIENQRADQE